MPMRMVGAGRASDVTGASERLGGAEGLLNKIHTGKSVLYIAPAGLAVDEFTMPDSRIACPSFARLKLAANGCFYRCDWCYLKLTYRAAFPYITVKTQYDRIQDQVRRWLAKSDGPVMFNAGELADSLALDPLTGAGAAFIPFFAGLSNGYLYMLTKSDEVEGILGLPHNGHTVLAWSLNAPEISRKFEIGAPTFSRRLKAAQKAQKAGFRVRLRIDPVVPVSGWKDLYADCVDRIFEKVNPERITVGTLRFEESFFRMKHQLLETGPEIFHIMETMEPMLTPVSVAGKHRLSRGKFSFPDSRRVEIFRFVCERIRKHSDCPVALCKETREIWQKVGLNGDRIQCACQP